MSLGVVSQCVEENILLQKLSHFSMSLSSGPLLRHETPSLQKSHALHLLRARQGAARQHKLLKRATHTASLFWAHSVSGRAAFSAACSPHARRLHSAPALTMGAPLVH